MHGELLSPLATSQEKPIYDLSATCLEDDNSY